MTGNADGGADRPATDAGITRGDAGPAAFGYGGASRCANANVLLCESFENGLDSATWTVSKPSTATVVVDDLRAARGTKALHLKANGVTAQMIRLRKIFPVKDNVLYGRMFVYLEDAVGNGHFSFAEGAGTVSRDVARWGGISGVLGVGSDGGPSGDWTDTDNKRIPAKQWMCLEFLFDGTTNGFKGWWDDEERTRLRSGMNRHAAYRTPLFNSLWFGWFLYNTPEAQELWIDEIAIDSNPIGCAK